MIGDYETDTTLAELGVEDVDPEMLCGEHAEPSVIITYSREIDGETATPRIYKVIGCWACGLAYDYITGIAEPGRFVTWDEL